MSAAGVVTLVDSFTDAGAQPLTFVGDVAMTSDVESLCWVTLGGSTNELRGYYSDGSTFATHTLPPGDPPQLIADGYTVWLLNQSTITRVEFLPNGTVFTEREAAVDPLLAGARFVPGNSSGR